MSYQSSPFGGVGNVEKDKAGGSAASTNAHYGLRDTKTGCCVVVRLVRRSVKEAVVYFTGDDFKRYYCVCHRPVLPAGSICCQLC